jgi:DNA-binding CsgD family transcriptional regulator
LGLVRARRGDPGCWPLLDVARDLAAGTAELQRIGPVAAARAEALWLEGRSALIAEETDAALALAVERRSPWLVGELATWRRRAGVVEKVDAEVAEPYAALLTGQYTPRPAALWDELGCPYEAALALADLRDERLGARPAAGIVARRLRGLGIRGVPRGPRASTRENVAHLTEREVEVLLLIADGLRNTAIADRLSLSRRTVDHHVSAILRKLGTATRGEAVAEADRLNLLHRARR